MVTFLTNEDREEISAEIDKKIESAGTGSGGGGVDLSEYAKKDDIPQKLSELVNDKGYITDYTETDPTVPNWAKAANKPGYTKSEVGLGNVENVKQYSANNPPPYPVTSVNGKTGAVTLDAEAVGADAKGTASGAVGDHNVSTSAHNDLRLLIDGLTTRLNALANSDDTTLDQMAEVVAYIKANRDLIDQITTGKVNVDDIVNNLTTNAANKTLSAAQGVVLKGLIDGLSTGKLDASKLQEAVNDALAQAKASGEFDGKPGEEGRRGNGVLRVSTSTTSSSGTGPTGIAIKYKIALATVKDEAGVDEVFVGDTILRSTYLYPVAKVDESYVYLGNYTNIKGSTGATGPKGADGKDYSFDPTVYGLPVLELAGDISPIAVSKDNKVTLDYVYGERSGTCTLKGQGATSYKTAQALVNAGKAGKFNYTIKFDTAFEAKSGWGAQEKYCLKANFIDTTHSRNICSCKLWGMSVKARSTVPTELANLPNGGAIDGFPCVIMLNGKFHGLYTWNIPKDGWMFGLVEDTTKTQAIVGADDHTAATQFKEASMTGFEVEFVSDEDNAAWVETSLTRMISAVMNSNGSDLDTTVAQYLDWDSAIDHYIHTVVDKATDCVDKNYLLVTFDGVKWYMSAYDRDSIHGLNWDASGTTRPVSNVSFLECAETAKVYELIKRFKTNALKARYKELRGNILSESRIMEKFENFAWAIPSPVMLEDVKLYPTILGSGVNTIDQIGRFVRQRLVRCDEWVDALPAQETPVEPEEPVEMVNQVPISTDTDGTIYNGTGYKDNARLSSSGGVSSSAQNGSVVTGFIPYTPYQPIEMKGAEWLNATANYQGHYYLNFYDSNKSLLESGGVSSDGYQGGSFDADLAVTYDETTGVTKFEWVDPSRTTGLTYRIKDAKYFRINAYGKGADLVVTVNQEITS